MHMCTKYEVCMFNLTLGLEEVCTDDDATPMPTTTTHDRQIMIVQGSLIDKPNEPKTSKFLPLSTHCVSRERVHCPILTCPGVHKEHCRHGNRSCDVEKNPS